MNRLNRSAVWLFVVLIAGVLVAAIVATFFGSYTLPFSVAVVGAIVARIPFVLFELEGATVYTQIAWMLTFACDGFLIGSSCHFLFEPKRHALGMVCALFAVSGAVGIWIGSRIRLRSSIFQKIFQKQHWRRR